MSLVCFSLEEKTGGSRAAARAKPAAGAQKYSEMARGHSYVKKPAQHARALELKATVVAWLQNSDDASLKQCLQQFASIKEWKTFAGTLARSWSAAGGNAEVAHYILHSDISVAENMWRMYEREEELKQGPHATDAEGAAGGAAKEGEMQSKVSNTAAVCNEASAESQNESQKQSQLEKQPTATATEAAAAAVEEAAAQQEERVREKAAACVKSRFVATHFRESKKDLAAKTLKLQGKPKTKKKYKFKNKCFK